MAGLAEVKEFIVPQVVVEVTWESLRDFGSRGCEGFVLWLGRVDGARAEIVVGLTPPQESIRSEEGVGYFVTSETLFHLNQQLHRTGLRLLGQVHSHPTEAYHSSTDDAYAVVTVEGGLSIVVPDFARHEPDPSECAIYRLRSGRWTELGLRDIEATFRWCDT